MQSTKLLCLLVLIFVLSCAMVTADVGYGRGPAGGFGGGSFGSGGGYYGDGGPAYPYNFQYAVNSPTGANFGQQESGQGGNVQGSYRVNLPDGRVQYVKYSASDATGYVADVQYQGTPFYPSGPGAYGGGAGAFGGGAFGGVGSHTYLPPAGK